MKEIWKPIAGYEGLYEVSNLGNVASLNYQNTGKRKVLALKHHSSGYVTVTLCNRGVHKNKSIHTLVARTFIDNPKNLPQVNHIDGDKTNNTVENLEWVTAKENMRHAVQNGLRDPHNNNARFGSDNTLKRSVYQYTKSGEFVREWDCISNAARHISSRPASVINCCKGRIKSLKGFVWSYTPPAQ